VNLTEKCNKKNAINPSYQLMRYIHPWNKWAI